jgi:hypothetical protein
MSRDRLIYKLAFFKNTPILNFGSLAIQKSNVYSKEQASLIANEISMFYEQLEQFQLCSACISGVARF